MKNIEPSLKGLRLLAALGAGEGLVRASRRLAVSQSGASHALAALEKTLGAPLVVRRVGGLRLSETGTRMLPHVHQILASLDAIRNAVTGLAGLQQGTLRLAAVPSLAGTIVPRLIREFSTRFPGVEVTLFEGTDNEVADWISNRTTDVGFAALPVPGLHAVEVMRDEWLALVPRTYLKGRTSVSLGTLSRRRFLLSGGGCEVHIRRLFRDLGLDLPPHLSVKQMSTIHAMVAEGLGVSVVPSNAVQEASKRFRTLHLAPRRYRSIGLLLHRDGPRSPALEAWIALVIERLAQKRSSPSRVA
jgi:DNA-binding transcriptional LysR family regulator